MICRHCGKEQKLSKEELSERHKRSARDDLKPRGAKRQFDYDLIRSMYADGLTMREIAKEVGATIPGISRIISKGKV
jgi:hypothetical protein